MCSLAQPWTAPRDGWTRKTKRYCSVSKVKKEAYTNNSSEQVPQGRSFPQINFPPNMQLGRNWIPYLRQRRVPSDSPRVSVLKAQRLSCYMTDIPEDSGNWNCWLLAIVNQLWGSKWPSWMWKPQLLHGLVPRPPPFFVLRFAFSIIHGSGLHWTQTEEQKNGGGRGTRLASSLCVGVSYYICFPEENMFPNTFPCDICSLYGY